VAVDAETRAAVPLLEREAELAELAAAATAASEGAGRLVVLEGTAGIGKSRLLGEARSIAAERGFRVLAARGGEFEVEFAYGIVRQLFEPFLSTLRPEVRDELFNGPAALAKPLFEIHETAAEGAVDSTFAIQHGLYWLVANITAEEPTLLVVDDLHWADSSSLRWLVYLVRRLEGLPLLVLSGTRPPDQGHDPELLVQLLTDPGAVSLEPRPLGVASISRMARETFGLDADEPFCAAVAVATGGNPLFVSALLDTASREKIAPVAASAREVLDLGPRAITRAVAMRLAQLPADAVEIAKAAAILGDGAALRDLAVLSGVDVVAAGRATAQLLRLDLLRRTEPLEFFHPVVRTAIHAEIDAGTRIVMHRRAAEILAAAGAPAEQVAGHLLQVAPAGDPAIVTSLRAAARRALVNGATEAAIAYLRRALDEPPLGEERFEVLLELGLAERRLAMPSAVQRLAEAADEGPDPVRAARASLEYGRMLFHANRPADAIDVLQRAGALLGDEDPDLAEQIDAELIGSSRWLTDYLSIAEERLSSISEDRLVGGVGTAQLLGVLAVDEAARAGSRERAADLARRALAMPEIAHEGAIGIYLALNALTQAGESVEAYRSYSLVVERARRTGDLFTLAGSLGFLGYIRIHHGELLDAEADLREGLELIRAAGNASAVFKWYAGTLANLLLERGERGEAAAVIESAELERQRPDDMQLFFLILARGQLRLARHEPELALADFSTIGSMGEAGASNNPGWVPWRTYAALALHQLDRDADALALANDELEIAHAWGAAVPVGVSLRVIGQLEGGEAGIGHLEAAAAIHAASPARLEHARSLVELGAALRRANRRTDARVKLRDGFELAHAIGATVVAEQAREELAATGARPRTPLRLGAETLTASERRVAQMAAHELSNKEIAQALFVTVKTVELHLSSVYRKLGIGSRKELAGAL
jgi:DNA-binding CsgD family transcriptional regulator